MWQRWGSSYEIKFENKVAKQAVEILKEAIKSGNYDEKYGYKESISSDICDMLDYEEYEGDTIGPLNAMWYDPYDTIPIMKEVLTYLAKALSSEAFFCTIFTSSTYVNSRIEAKYDGEKLVYRYILEDVGWDYLNCESCGYEGEIEKEQYNSEGVYICPECGEKIKNVEKYKEECCEIVIKN